MKRLLIISMVTLSIGCSKSKEKDKCGEVTQVASYSDTTCCPVNIQTRYIIYVRYADRSRSYNMPDTNYFQRPYRVGDTFCE
jgi:hypothetical protein